MPLKTDIFSAFLKHKCNRIRCEQEQTIANSTTCCKHLILRITHIRMAIDNQKYSKELQHVYADVTCFQFVHNYFYWFDNALEIYLVECLRSSSSFSDGRA